MLDDTQKALDAFNKPTDDEKAGLGTFDIWCGGDFEMWKKVANTMRLRIALRLSKRADEMKAAGYDLPAIAKAAAGNTLANGGKDIMIDKSLENELWLMFA